MDDLISRQAAIDAVEKESRVDGAYGYMDTKSIVDLLNDLSSVQPGIIRCKDCKWYGRVDKRRFYRGMDCLQKHIDTIVPDRDFCSKAERRKQ